LHRHHAFLQRTPITLGCQTEAIVAQDVTQDMRHQRRVGGRKTGSIDDLRGDVDFCRGADALGDVIFDDVIFRREPTLLLGADMALLGADMELVPDSGAVLMGTSIWGNRYSMM